MRLLVILIVSILSPVVQPVKAQDKAIVFSRPSCINCPAAKELVETLTHEYTVIHDREGAVPRISYQGKTVVGYNPKAIAELFGVSEPPVPVRSSVATVRHVMKAPGPNWTWPGDLKSHLLNGHGHSPEELAGLSQSELRALHDNDHNGASVRAVSQPRRIFSGPRIFRRGRSSGGCPGGVCP